jgi:hypothetical protein
LGDASGTVEGTTVDRELAEYTEIFASESSEAEDPTAAPAEPGRVRWVELVSLIVVLAVIIAVCRGIQRLLGI